MGNRTMRRMLTTLFAALLVLIMTPALADNVTSAAQLCDALTNGRNAVLTGDIDIGTGCTISGGNVTLDLNGHALRPVDGGNALITIANGAMLTVTDSSAGSTVVSYAAGANGSVTYDGTGVMAPGNGNHRTWFHVNGGTLNVNGGVFRDNTKTPITASGGTVNISGKAVLANQHTQESGSVIRAENGATVNISGGKIVGNRSSADGGAIRIQGSGATLNLSGGEVSSNRSDCSGGGIAIFNDANFYLSGTGKVDNNMSQDFGGGAIVAYGSLMEMRGGVVSNNRAYKREGGGITVNNGSYVNIYKGEITGNRTGYDRENNAYAGYGDWGGGGIFVCENSYITFPARTLITGNSAGGFGGGMAGCSTGRLYVYPEHMAIYDNEADGEHVSGSQSTKSLDHVYAKGNEVFMSNGYQDYFCALVSAISNVMYDGGYANWSGSADGAPVAAAANSGEELSALYSMGLTANEYNAPTAGDVVISGNRSYTHGGGILVNGLLFTSDEREYDVGDALDMSARKAVENADGASAAGFRFEVRGADNQVVSVGTSRADGSIVFDRMLTFKKEGTFTFTLREAGESNPAYDMDDSVYTIEVEVRKDVRQRQFRTSGSTSTVTMNDYQIRSIRVKKNGQDYSSYTAKDLDNESHAAALQLYKDGGATFTNRAKGVEPVSVSGTKTWVNDTASDRPASITVRLLANGAEVSSQTVTEESGWTYTFMNLNKYDAQGNLITYTVTEDAVAGYMTRVNGFNLINTLETMRISGSKTWEDEDNARNLRPESITVYLYADGELIAERTVSAQDDWNYSFENLRIVGKNGAKIRYTVAEVPIAGYMSTIDGYNIINTLLDKYPAMPNTGDDSSSAAVAAALLSSVMGLILILRRKKDA